MNNLMVYLLESALSMGLFILVYRMGFMEDTNFSMRRIFLLSSVGISLILPVINVDTGNPPLAFPTLLLKEINIYENGLESIRKESGIPLFILIGLYAVVTGLLFSRIIYQLIKVGRKATHPDPVRIENLSLFIIPGSDSFSFFRRIYIGNISKGDDRMKILEHEKVHARQLHSLDVLFLEILCSLMWFNPFTWWYRNEIKNVHEYLADEGALSQGINIKSYQITLLEHLIGSASLSITNNFNYSLLKNRLAMMNKIKNGRRNYWKYFLLLPAASFLLFFFACTENQPEEEVVVISSADEKVYYIVEEMPLFNGGDPATEFRKYVGENLKYPEDASENRISGRVFVQFAIDPDGEVEDVNIIKSVHPSLDREAVRVISSSPRWTPGRQEGERVKVMFTFPINFVLDSI